MDRVLSEALPWYRQTLDISLLYRMIYDYDYTSYIHICGVLRTPPNKPIFFTFLQQEEEMGFQNLDSQC